MYGKYIGGGHWGCWVEMAQSRRGLTVQLYSLSHKYTHLPSPPWQIFFKFSFIFVSCFGQNYKQLKRLTWIKCANLQPVMSHKYSRLENDGGEVVVMMQMMMMIMIILILMPMMMMVMRCLPWNTGV